MFLEKNILKIYEELVELRHRLSDDESELLGDEHIILDHVLDFIEALARIKYVIYDNNKGSKELKLGVIDYEWEEEDITIRVHD